MNTDRGTVELKSGETMQVLRIAPPDVDWKEPVIALVEHEDESWRAGLDVMFDQPFDGVQIFFYLGTVDGELVGNIETIEAVEAGVGILGHVFTSPTHRRKGICSAIMDVLTRDFAERGGQAMTLSAGYDSPPYHIYHSFGFRGVGETGKMIWEAEPGFLANYFSPGPTTVRDIGWPDWALLDLLYKVEVGSFLRGGYYAYYGPSSYEGNFWRFHKLVQEPPSQSQVLVKDGGEVVGHALLLPDPRWAKATLLLDIFIHPDFYEAGGQLLEAFELPSGIKVQAYADDQSAEKIQLLRQHGFRQEAVLDAQIKGPAGHPLDVVILSLSI